MSDKIYITSDVPSDYKYAVFSQNYITLYNKPQAYNETLHYYRIYFTYSSGLVVEGNTTFTGYNTQVFTPVQTSYEVFDRPDFVNILTCTLIVAVFGLWLFNLMTSIVKKGGLLGGLI